MPREPEDEELVPTRVRCTACGSLCTIGFVADRPIRDELAASPCPSCGSHRLRLERPLPPTPVRRIGIHEEPADELGDEEMLEHRARMK